MVPYITLHPGNLLTNDACFESLQTEHKRNISICDGKHGGEVRGIKCKYTAILFTTLIEYVWSEELSQPKSTLKLTYEQNFKLITPRGYIPTGVDTCISVGDKLLACVEIKTYMESTMLKRTLQDAYSIYRLTNGTVKEYPIFVLQPCVPSEVLLGCEDELRRQVNDDAVNIPMFSACKNLRNPFKPIHVTQYFEPIDRESIEKFIQYMSNFLRIYCS